MKRRMWGIKLSGIYSISTLYLPVAYLLMGLMQI